MDNPILVFVKLHDFPELGEARLNSIAWDTSGERLHSVDATRNVSVLVLDDAATTPEDITFANSDPNGPLLIVWHRGSRLHTISQIQTDNTIRSWGTPRECATFSHNDGSVTWTDVKKLICSDLTAIDFAKRQRARFDLQQLEIWAAICQIGIFEPGLDRSNTQHALDFATAVKDTLRQLPSEIFEEGAEQWDKPPVDWPELLKKVRAYVAPLAREQLTE